MQKRKKASAPSRRAPNHPAAGDAPSPIIGSDGVERTPLLRRMLPAAQAPAEASPEPARATRVKREKTKVRATFHLPKDLVEMARDVVIALGGAPHRLTLASLVEKALTAEIDRLVREVNGGEPFPKYGEPLRGGRPVRS
jgi:hypothetical protein